MLMVNNLFKSFYFDSKVGIFSTGSREKIRGFAGIFSEMTCEIAYVYHIYIYCYYIRTPIEAG